MLPWVGPDATQTLARIRSAGRPSRCHDAVRVRSLTPGTRYNTGRSCPSLPSHQHAHDGNGARGQAFAHILSSFRMGKEIIHGGCEESMANCVDCVSVLSSCRLHVWCQYVNISFYPHPSRKCEPQPVISTRTQLSPML